MLIPLHNQSPLCKYYASSERLGLALEQSGGDSQS